MKNGLAWTSIYFLTSSVCLNLTSCDLESEHNLGGGYYLIGNEANTTVCKVDETRKYLYDSIILGEIIDYDFDENFIVVFRNASQEAKQYNTLQDSLWNKQKGNDSLQFWILEKNKHLIYGPLDLNDYILKKRELKISLNVVIK